MKTIISFILLIFLNSEISFAIQNVNDDPSLSQYFDLLKRYPHLKQEGKHTKGETEILVDPSEIAGISKSEYERLLSKKIVPELAKDWSRPGIVYSDSYLLWIRDPVIFPDGKKGLYKRIIWKCTLNQENPVAVLPINKDSKLGLIKIWRHATGSWELEIPRGSPNPFEAPIDTASRELKEETGLIANQIIEVGNMNPDSGILATNLRVFIAFCSNEGLSNLDDSEVISGTYFFSLKELEQGLIDGFLEINEKGHVHKIFLRDPFLVFALYQARIRNLL